MEHLLYLRIHGMNPLAVELRLDSICEMRPRSTWKRTSLRYNHIAVSSIGVINWLFCIHMMCTKFIVAVCVEVKQCSMNQHILLCFDSAK